MLSPRSRLVGDSLAVELPTLTRKALVRIQVPQPPASDFQRTTRDRHTPLHRILAGAPKMPAFRPQSYVGTMPYALYQALRNHETLCQSAHEGDAAWLHRLSRSELAFRTLVLTDEEQKMILSEAGARARHGSASRPSERSFNSAPLNDDDLLAAQNAHRRTMSKLVHDALFVRNAQSAWTPVANAGFDRIVARDHNPMTPQEAFELCVEQFHAVTVRDGAIFWNGIDEMKLVALVDEWNQIANVAQFNQLEATTEIRLINKKFEWADNEEKGVRGNAAYFGAVSGALGHHATGHVTAVAMCGLRNDSILTHTELPNMLGQMNDQLASGEQPGMTDITIVVIRPKDYSNIEYKEFTNLEILQIPIVKKNGDVRFITKRDDCEKIAEVGNFVSDQNLAAKRPNDMTHLLKYWENKWPGPSIAGVKIMHDIARLT
eukprot:gene10968-11049_t